MGYGIELKVLLIILLILWLSILIVRRHPSGIATIQERRFESAIRTFAVELML